VIRCGLVAASPTVYLGYSSYSEKLSSKKVTSFGTGFGTAYHHLTILMRAMFEPAITSSTFDT